MSRMAGFCSCVHGHSQFDAHVVGWLLRATRQRLTDGDIHSLCVTAQTGKIGDKTEAKRVCQPQTGRCAAG